MAQIIPGLSQPVLSKMTSGEKRLARRFESHLEDDYLCWYDIPIGKKRRYPDFILLHPARGILLLEVKDWKIDTLKSINKTTANIITPKGLKTVPNPVEQCRQYAYATINLFEKDPLLKQTEGQYKGRLLFPYGWGVVFSNITRKQWDKALSQEAQEIVLPPHLLICQDEMVESTDPEIFQERLWAMFQYRFGNMLTKPQIDRIRWHLHPEMRINAPVQGDLLPANEGNDQASVPDLIKVMDLQQERIARNLGEGHRVIHGVAGSGKTLILGFRALYLTDVVTKPILILCFNISLAAKLRAFIDEKGVGSQVQVYHFHHWCGELLKTYGIPTIENNEKPVWERQVDSVIQAVDQGQIPRAQYGAVLIDEGHDFEEEWLRLIPQMIDPDTNALLLLYDDAQSIYKRSSLGFSLSSVGIQAKGRTSILKLNYRNTQEILSFSYAFAKHYIDPHASDEDHIPLIEPTSVGDNGPEPEFRLLENLETEVAFIGQCIAKWQREGVSLADIAVLYGQYGIAKKLDSYLKANNISCLWMNNRKNKNAYSPYEERVTLLTIHSSKGLEFQRVILAGMPTIKDGETAADHARLVYVGMTRAQRHLLITSSDAEHVFTKDIQKIG